MRFGGGGLWAMGDRRGAMVVGLEAELGLYNDAGMSNLFNHGE